MLRTDSPLTDPELWDAAVPGSRCTGSKKIPAILTLSAGLVLAVLCRPFLHVHEWGGSLQYLLTKKCASTASCRPMQGTDAKHSRGRPLTPPAWSWHTSASGSRVQNSMHPCTRGRFIAASTDEIIPSEFGIIDRVINDVISNERVPKSEPDATDGAPGEPLDIERVPSEPVSLDAGLQLSSRVMTKARVKMPRLLWVVASRKDIVRRAWNAGYDGYDLSRVTEEKMEEVGEGLRALFDEGVSRDSLFIQATIRPEDANRSYGQWPLRQQVKWTVDKALANLGLLYFDSVVLSQPFEEYNKTLDFWMAMEATVECGMVRQLGIANVRDLNQLEGIVNEAEVKPAVVQQMFSAIGVGHAVRMYCNEKEIFFQCAPIFAEIMDTPQMNRLADKYGSVPQALYLRLVMGLNAIPMVVAYRKWELEMYASALSIPLLPFDVGIIIGLLFRNSLAQKQLEASRAMEIANVTSASFFVAAPPGRTEDDKLFRFLVFGDCFSSGYPSYEPYAKALSASLAKEGFFVEIVGVGFTGITALQLKAQLDARVIRDARGKAGPGLNAMLATQGPFDLALIQVGHFDIREGIDAGLISQAIWQLHRTCHDSGVSTVALSVPPSWMDTDADLMLRASRHEVNKNLQHDSWQRSRVEQTTLYVDTEVFIKYDSAAAADKSELWEPDGAHLTPAGSRKFGEKLAPLLVSTLDKMDSWEGNTAINGLARPTEADQSVIATPEGVKLDVRGMPWEESKKEREKKLAEKGWLQDKTKPEEEPTVPPQKLDGEGDHDPNDWGEFAAPSPSGVYGEGGDLVTGGMSWDDNDDKSILTDPWEEEEYWLSEDDGPPPENDQEYWERIEEQEAGGPSTVKAKEWETEVRDPQTGKSIVTVTGQEPFRATSPLLTPRSNPKPPSLFPGGIDGVGSGE
eukprot:gnl/TRDRNA2_/TRDRNA2_85220_c0_seq1.p1 gnl/TRDRNA2_/TRDRNA2_85220_c0~~gnl/TRDRNA2_/TRDRNA2_85220_c0_seq1.p1  ORF type:complete len:913 (-),score=146.63 gnl/TRDRNA2_/TRDRNA2_85220_c0_seq1:64-2802(-)